MDKAKGLPLWRRIYHLYRLLAVLLVLPLWGYVFYKIDVVFGENGVKAVGFLVFLAVIVMILNLAWEDQTGKSFSRWLYDWTKPE